MPAAASCAMTIQCGEERRDAFAGRGGRDSVLRLLDRGVRGGRDVVEVLLGGREQRVQPAQCSAHRHATQRAINAEDATRRAKNRRTRARHAAAKAQEEHENLVRAAGQADKPAGQDTRHTDRANPDQTTRDEQILARTQAKRDATSARAAEREAANDSDVTQTTDRSATEHQTAR